MAARRLQQRLVRGSKTSFPRVFCWHCMLLRCLRVVEADHDRYGRRAISRILFRRYDFIPPSIRQDIVLICHQVSSPTSQPHPHTSPRKSSRRASNSKVATTTPTSTQATTTAPPSTLPAPLRVQKATAPSFTAIKRRSGATCPSQLCSSLSTRRSGDGQKSTWAQITSDCPLKSPLQQPPAAWQA